MTTGLGMLNKPAKQQSELGQLVLCLSGIEAPAEKQRSAAGAGIAPT